MFFRPYEANGMVRASIYLPLLTGIPGVLQEAGTFTLLCSSSDFPWGILSKPLPPRPFEH
jgi:hypothetical protein